VIEMVQILQIWTLKSLIWQPWLSGC